MFRERERFAIRGASCGPMWKTRSDASPLRGLAPAPEGSGPMLILHLFDRQVSRGRIPELSTM